MINQKDILKKIDSLPTLPTAVVRLSKIVNDPNSSISDFERAITPDVALTANLLKICNSALYRRAREINSVKHAIAMLGIKHVFEVAMTAAFSKVIPPVLVGYNTNSKRFWQHNLAVAIIAEEFAKKQEIQEVEGVFTAGLLHDIGKLVISTFLDEHNMELMEMLPKGENTFVKMEDMLLGTNHTEVGELIADKWGLPETIIMGARWHHDPDSCDDEKYQVLVDLIHLSNVLARSLGFGNDVGELSRAVKKTSIKRLGLNQQIIEEVASEAATKVQQMQGFIEIENGGN